MSAPESPKPKRVKRPKDPHPNDRFTLWKKAEFVDEVRRRARAAGLTLTAPQVKAVVTLTLEALYDVAARGIIVSFHGFMRWGPHTQRATTYERNGVQVHRRSCTVPHVKFSPTYRQRVKEAHEDHAES